MKRKRKRKPAHCRALSRGCRLSNRSVTARNRARQCAWLLVNGGCRHLLEPTICDTAVERELYRQAHRIPTLKADFDAEKYTPRSFCEYLRRNPKFKRELLAAT